MSISTKCQSTHKMSNSEAPFCSQVEAHNYITVSLVSRSLLVSTLPTDPYPTPYPNLCNKISSQRRSEVGKCGTLPPLLFKYGIFVHATVSEQTPLTQVFST